MPKQFEHAAQTIPAYAEELVNYLNLLAEEIAAQKAPSKRPEYQSGTIYGLRYAAQHIAQDLPSLMRDEQRRAGKDV